MRLVVVSHKLCWTSVDSPSGYVTDGGFSLQMEAISELFAATTLVMPCSDEPQQSGVNPLVGQNLTVVPLSNPSGTGLRRKLGLLVWLGLNLKTIVREIRCADAVHTPIPGDVGSIGMLLAFVLRKPLFVRHCGNWLKPVTKAEHFWKWFMEKFAGEKQVMLATGGAAEPPSRRNDSVRWIFSTSLSEEELQSCSVSRQSLVPDHARLIIVCRQDRQKGTGTVIQSLPQILKTLPGVSLDVVGDGASLAEFQRMAESLGVNDRVRFHGKVNHDAVVGLLRQADLFCYPTSASEGFPKVVLEALACGLPVVTTRVSVLPELMSSGAGELLNEVTPSAVAEAVVGILSDAERYREMSARAIETAARYSLEHWRDTIGDQLRAAWGELRSGEPESTGAQIDLTKLRVCFLAGTLGRGGAERQLIFMLRALTQAGVQTRVLCLTSGEALEKEIREMGIAVTWVGASRWRPIRLLRIIRELRREPADIVQSAHFYTNLYAAVTGRFLGIKTIGAIRSDLNNELRSNGLMGWGHLHFPIHLISNSLVARQKAIARRIEPNHIHFLPNVVDVNRVSPKPDRNGNGKGPVRILFAGRLTEEKRPDRFLRTLSKILLRRPTLDFKATIIGDGPLRPSLEELADSLGLRPKYLEFLGELGDLKTAYRTSDLLVLTSDREGTPNVLLEAMGNGLPIVATKVGGIPALIRDGEIGFLVEVGDDDSVVSAVASLIENPQLRISMGLAGHRVALEKHSPDRLAGALAAIYERVLG